MRSPLDAVHARRCSERGSLAVELAMVTPALLLLLALVYAYGRTALISGTIESATRDAARSATMARTEGDATARAKAVVNEAAAHLPSSCRDTLDVEVSDTFRPGDFLTVTASCGFTVSDLGLPGVTKPIRAESSFTSSIDPRRGVG